MFSLLPVGFSQPITERRSGAVPVWRLRVDSRLDSCATHGDETLSAVAQRQEDFRCGLPRLGRQVALELLDSVCGRVGLPFEATFRTFCFVLYCIVLICCAAAYWTFFMGLFYLHHQLLCCCILDIFYEIILSTLPIECACANCNLFALSDFL